MTKVCAHGVGVRKEDHCPACLLIWHEDGLRSAQAAVVRHTAHVERLRAEVAKAVRPENVGRPVPPHGSGP